MRSRVELIIEITHPAEYDPANEFVWYFCDNADLDFNPGPDDYFVVVEAWDET